MKQKKTGVIESKSGKDKAIKTKLCVLSLFFISLAVFSFIMEHIFYGYLDQEGFLQESFFLPMGFISFLLGSLGLMISVIRYVISKINTKS